MDRKNRARTLGVALMGLAAAGLTGCGLQMGLPAVVPSNTPPGTGPVSGNQVAAGGFSAQNGASVSGSVAVYSQGNGTYTVQLQNLSATLPTLPDTVDALVNGFRMSGQQLTNTSGTSTYTFSTSNGAEFQAVYIHCTTCAGSIDYATAALH